MSTDTDPNNDILLKTEDLLWVPIAEGIEFKLLRTSPESGTWTVLFRAQAGSTFAKHRHLGAGEYYVIKGKMAYRAGEAVTGDYGYEPLDSVHELTTFVEYTELYFTNFGPVAFLDDDDQVTMILDHNVLKKMEADHALETAA